MSARSTSRVSRRSSRMRGRRRPRGTPRSSRPCSLSLWRGRAYADFAGEAFAQAEAERLERLRLSCLEERFDAELALAHNAEALPELQRIADEAPLQEPLTAKTMIALYRCGLNSHAPER